MCKLILALQQQQKKIFFDVLETKNVKKVKMLIVYPLLELQHDRALVNALYIRDSLNSTGGVVYM